MRKYIKRPLLLCIEDTATYEAKQIIKIKKEAII